MLLRGIFVCTIDTGITGVIDTRHRRREHGIKKSVCNAVFGKWPPSHCRCICSCSRASRLRCASLRTVFRGSCRTQGQFLFLSFHSSRCGRMRGKGGCTPAMPRPISLCPWPIDREQSNLRPFAAFVRLSSSSAATLDRRFAGRFPRLTGFTSSTSIALPSTSCILPKRMPVICGRCAKISKTAWSSATRQPIRSANKLRMHVFATCILRFRRFSIRWKTGSSRHIRAGRIAST